MAEFDESDYAAAIDRTLSEMGVEPPPPGCTSAELFASHPDRVALAARVEANWETWRNAWAQLVDLAAIQKDVTEQLAKDMFERMTLSEWVSLTGDDLDDYLSGS